MVLVIKGIKNQMATLSQFQENLHQSTSLLTDWQGVVGRYLTWSQTAFKGLNFIFHICLNPKMMSSTNHLYKVNHEHDSKRIWMKIIQWCPTGHGTWSFFFFLFTITLWMKLYFYMASIISSMLVTRNTSSHSLPKIPQLLLGSQHAWKTSSLVADFFIKRLFI